jgi:hypothetical protein
MSYMDPIKEAKAALALRESLASLNEDDALLIDMIEGETGLFEVFDKLLARMTADQALMVGIDAVVSDLEARKARFAKRRETDRALIEQALMIAEIETAVERPAGTLSLTKRPAKLVISTESDIPADYWKPADPVLDKKALTAALKDGAVVPGATLSNAAPSLTIRTK